MVTCNMYRKLREIWSSKFLDI